MRKINPLFVVFILLFAAGMSSCTNYGKKIKIEGTKAEVYYKEGVTETEAKKVGDLLKEDGYLGNEKAASLQVIKEDGGYTVRFVYDKAYYDKTEGLENLFKQYSSKLSKEVFNDKKVNIALSDNQFKDFKNIPYDETVAKAPGETFNKDDFDHDKAGDIAFYWKGVSDKESKVIADYIVENGAFAGGTAEIYITKEGDRYLLRFPVKKEYRDNPATIAEIERVSKQIKENVFANNPYSFQMTDEMLNPIKSFEY
jgi:hypothetical protein